MYNAIKYRFFKICIQSIVCNNFSSSTFILQWTKRPPKVRMMTYQGTFFHWKQEILGWSLLAWQLSFISSHITAQGFQFFPSWWFCKVQILLLLYLCLCSGLSYVCMHAQNLLSNTLRLNFESMDAMRVIIIKIIALKS